MAALPGKLEGVSILVVDDELDSREVLAELLRPFGAQTSTASSAEEALAEIARETPQVLLSDIGMPLVDGYELLRRVRELIPETEMLAMALTGLGSAHDRNRALTEGIPALHGQAGGTGKSGGSDQTATTAAPTILAVAFATRPRRKSDSHY